MIVALAGNPNCGKTTLFNSLTGLNYKVANYPGVTVERKEAELELADVGRVTLLDLPGIYSLSGISIDEKIASDILLKKESELDQVAAVIVVVDGSNLERNLYLVSQLIDAKQPLLIALNMVDLAKKNGLHIREELLARLLDVPVVPIVASKGKGVEDLKTALGKLLQNPTISKESYRWTNGVTDFGVDPFGFEATKRYAYINDIAKKALVDDHLNKRPFSDRCDAILTHKIWGSLIFLTLMTAMFQSIFLWATIPMDLIDQGFQTLSNTLQQLLPTGQIQSLITDGIIPGVGSVVIFVPQIAILFLFLGLLEDTGYLTRAAFLMDRALRPFGLQGRSFIPLLSSFACAIPGILSSRTIPSWADRMATILVAPLMSCSARLPVYAVLIGAFIPAKFYGGVVSLQGLVLLAMYLLGIIGACAVSYLLKLTFFKGQPALFVMEMPPYRLPTIKNVSRQVWDSVRAFIKSAGTVILACSIIMWFLASYPLDKKSVQESYAGQIGSAMEPLIKPLGYDWEIGVAILASFAAREVFVSTLATVYNLQEEQGNTGGLIELLKKKHLAGTFPISTALSLMVFYVFSCMCMSTLAVCKRETGSWWWAALMFGYMTTLAYLSAFIVFQLAQRIS